MTRRGGVEDVVDGGWKGVGFGEDGEGGVDKGVGAWGKRRKGERIRGWGTGGWGIEGMEVDLGSALRRDVGRMFKVVGFQVGHLWGEGGAWMETKSRLSGLKKKFT